MVVVSLGGHMVHEYSGLCDPNWLAHLVIVYIYDRKLVNVFNLPYSRGLEWSKAGCEEKWYTHNLVSVTINPTRWWQEPKQFFNGTMAVIDIAAWYHGIRHRKGMTKHIELVLARLDGA